MPLSGAAAKDLLEEMLQIRQADAPGLETYHSYVRGAQPHPVSLEGVPPEAVRFIDQSRVNIVDLVVEVMAQSLYVDGYRPNVADVGAIDEAAGWEAWQANKLDSRQVAVHRGAFTYGISYVLVLPGESGMPSIRGYSPRKLTVAYGDDPDWPFAAVLAEANGEHMSYTLYDSEAAYRFTTEGGLVAVESEPLGETGGVCPVVRFLNVEDLDDETLSEVDRLIPIQDQIDTTTFELQVAQHFQAFLQRYIIGWTPESVPEQMKAMASRMWTFADADVQVGQFQQAQLDGYLRSREESVQLGAIVSQTPPHHLLGELINLSAEALAAAESGHRRKINQRQTTLGEAWEQVLELAELMMGAPVPEESAQVRWRDTEARSLAQTVDALGKMAQMLDIPPEALWERIPGVTQQDLQLFKQLASQADALTQLTGILEAQLAPAPPNGQPTAPVGVPPT